MRTSNLQESLGEGCLAQQVRVTGSILCVWGGCGQDAPEHTPKGPGWRIWLLKGAVSHSSCERCPLAAGQTLASLQVRYTAPCGTGTCVGRNGGTGWVWRVGS